MKATQASRTALLIAGSLVLLRHDPKYSRAIPRTSADRCARLLKTYSARTRLFLKITRWPWVRAIAKLIERITIPGILLHYALRKKNISQLARAALIHGTKQLVVIGAGFDPLSLELHREFRTAQFWEIDHPATQGYKARAFPEIDNQRFHFIANNLSSAALDKNALKNSGFDSAQPTFWIAEGLLMYLPADTVSRLMITLKELSTPGSQFVFTFMEKQSNGRIRFHSQSKLVDWWLSRRGEPFVWGTTRRELVDFVRPWRILRFFDHNDLHEIDSALADEPLATGEVICLAEI